VKVLRLRTSVSTQTRARRMAEAGAPAWTAVVAERQTRGRGRMERRWSSGKGGLYVSVILRPSMAPAQLEGLSLASAKACAKALERLSGLDVFIKPPNDILARRPGSGEEPRKVCGILLEASGDTRRVDWVVLGVGMNLNNRVPRELDKAASVSALTGKDSDVEKALGLLLRELRAGL
jgi:BirA family biotin operon repressor/biotin-[acetyl-CoA-carboxylase] ligase